MEESNVAEPVVPETPETPEAAPTPDPVVVIARQPSSDSPTQAEATPAEAEAPPSLEDAARTLIGFIRGHRTIGDSDVDAAVTAVESALAATA